MDARSRGREQVLTALLVSPDREMARQFLATVPEARVFQILSDMKAYPAANTLEIRLRQMRPDILLIDVATDPDIAGGLIQFTVNLGSIGAQVVGLHNTNDSAAVVRILRTGAIEFLHAPFDTPTQREAAARLRRLRQPEPVAERRVNGRVIALSSAKPGSGSTTLATHLAHAIRKSSGCRVLLADLDLEGGTVAFFLKLQPSYSVVDALEQVDSLDSAMWSELIVPAGGVDVLAAPGQPFSQAIDQSRLHDLIEYTRTVYDWTVIDVPSIFHRVSLLALSEADKAYLVSTSDLASLHLARRALGLLTQLGFARERYEVVVNRLSRRDGIGGSDIEKIFNCPVHATLPNDYFALHRVISLGQPLNSDCDLGRAIGALAARICGPSPADKKRAGGVPDPRPALSQT